MSKKLSFDLRFRRRQLVDTMFSLFQAKGWTNNAFLKLDTDKNLKISMKEFSQPLQDVNINLSHKDLRLLVSFFDKGWFCSRFASWAQRVAAHPFFADGSGGVDFDEFTKRYNQVSSSLLSYSLGAGFSL
jgi:hypothetical protein